MNKDSIRIYYNPRCSKCRETVALVTERGYTTELVEYLLNPPSKEELRDLLSKLNMQPQELLRKGEEVYKLNYSGRSLNDEEWLEVLLAHPVLMERPIVVRGNKAVVARPAEKALTLL